LSRVLLIRAATSPGLATSSLQSAATGWSCSRRLRPVSRGSRSSSAGSGLYRSHSQGRKTKRPPGAGADQVRAGHQPQDREGARPHYPALSARARGRSYRMKRQRMSAFDHSGHSPPNAVWRISRASRRVTAGHDAGCGLACDLPSLPLGPTLGL
jgi:hypothetical protein